MIGESLEVLRVLWRTRGFLPQDEVRVFCKDCPDDASGMFDSEFGTEIYAGLVIDFLNNQASGEEGHHLHYEKL